MRRFGVRAVLAAALLLGVYVLLAGLAVGSLVLLRFLVHHPSPLVFGLLIASASVLIGCVRALLAGLRRPAPPTGVRTTRHQQPTLWDLVERTATEVGAPVPDQLWLDLSVNAYVLQAGGFPRTERHLVLGLPLMVALDRDELTAVVAHEMGHYANKDVALGPVVRRGWVTVARMAQHVGGHRLVGPMVMAYAKLYLRVSMSVSREQELAADRAAARATSGDALARGLQLLPWVEGAWVWFGERFLAAPLAAGTLPADFLDGFARLLDEPERVAERTAYLDAPPNAFEHAYDSHPSMAHRLDQLGATTASPRSGLRAVTLLDLPPVVAALAGGALGSSLRMTTMAASAGAGGDARARGNARALLLATASGLPEGAPVGLGSVLSTLEQGTYGVGSRLCGAETDRHEARQAVARCLTDLLHCALVDSGQASWTYSFAGAPYRLMSPAYGEVDLLPVVSASLTDERRLSELAARCDALGLTPEYAAA